MLPLLAGALETISIKIWETPLSWLAKCSLPVAVRVSKTCVLLSSNRVSKIALNSSILALGRTVNVSLYKIYGILERFSNECPKTKTKVITLANQKGRRQSSKPIKTPSNYT